MSQMGNSEIGSEWFFQTGYQAKSWSSRRARSFVEATAKDVRLAVVTKPVAGPMRQIALASRVYCATSGHDQGAHRGQDPAVPAKTTRRYDERSNRSTIDLWRVPQFSMAASIKAGNERERQCSNP